MSRRTEQIPQEAALFRARLRDIRENRFKLSHELFARKVDISSKSIFDWEKGPAMPGIPSLIKLARACEVSTDYLLGLTDKRKPPAPSVERAPSSSPTKREGSGEVASVRGKRRAGGEPPSPRARRPRSA